MQSDILAIILIFIHHKFIFLINPLDMSANLQITGWPAHDSAVCSVLFGPDETSIFSLGSDGKVSGLFDMSICFGDITALTSC